MTDYLMTDKDMKAIQEQIAERHTVFVNALVWRLTEFGVAPLVIKSALEYAGMELLGHVQAEIPIEYEHYRED
jgi:hypothetical protein